MSNDMVSPSEISSLGSFLHSIIEHCERPLTSCHHQKSSLCSFLQSINTHCEHPLLWCHHRRPLVYAYSHQQSINTHCECPLTWCCLHRELVFGVSHQHTECLIRIMLPSPITIVSAVSYQWSINAHTMNVNLWNGTHRRQQHIEP